MPASYWMTSPCPLTYPALTGDMEVDVPWWAAVLLASARHGSWSAGRQVTVLEATRIVAGVTGHTTAKLSSLHTMIYDA
ncbi:MAG TPA: hypothetical protein VGD71_34020 [Kribbella sp.]